MPKTKSTAIQDTSPTPTATPNPTPAPVTQQSIGTTPALPVYVKVDQGGIPSWLGLLITVVFAMLAAIAAQMVAHNRATARDKKSRYEDALADVIHKSAAVNASMSQITGTYRRHLEVQSAGHVTPDDFESLNAGIRRFVHAAAALETSTLVLAIRAEEDDPVLAQLDDTKPLLIDFNVNVAETPTSERALDKMDESHREYVRRLNRVEKLARTGTPPTP